MCSRLFAETYVFPIAHAQCSFIRTVLGHENGRDRSASLVHLNRLPPTYHSDQQTERVLYYLLRKVIFRAENGGGQLVVENTAEDPLRLCDGQWHKIRAWKEGNLVKLQVDEGTILEGERKGSQTNTNTYDPLYVGGLPGRYMVHA